jgi:hypothetical protein
MSAKQNTNSSIYVFGNSFASLAAISKLREKNLDFIWVHQGTNIEGIWRGISYKDRILDLGMINFELDVRHPNPSSDLSTYSQYTINDCARFSSVVSDFISKDLELKQLPQIKVFENGNLYPDHLISNNFSDLIRFSSSSILGTSIPEYLHPSKKYSIKGRDNLINISYLDYVENFFGKKTARDLFLIWADHLIGTNVSLSNTYRHRAAWLPLPYPETIQAAIAGEPIEDYSYNFHYPSDVTFSEYANKTFLKLFEDSFIQKIDFNTLEKSELRQILNSNSNVFWGGKLDLFLSEVEEQDIFEVTKYRNLIDIDVYEIQLISTFNEYVVLNNDPVDESWYRITIIPNVVFEGNRRIAVIESRGSKVDFLATQHFQSLGINIDSHVKSIKGIPVFLTLDGQQYINYENWYQFFTLKYQNVEFGGGSSFAYSATFSDQIIQGVKFSEKVSDNDKQ